MQTITQALHFETGNCAQAFALALAGFPLLALRNEYSPEQLAKLGCTAREAWQKGQPGTRTYTFASSAELTAAIAAWDEECAILRAKGDPTDVPVAQLDVVRIAACVLAQRTRWAAMWQQVVPSLIVHHSGAPTDRNLPDGRTTTTFPGFTRISINAEPADLALLDKHRR
jgi:hypothetical protein